MEPLTDFCRNIFQQYRKVRVRVLSHLYEQSRKRAEQANRHRQPRAVKVGDEVVFRDPRQRKAGGRTPYRRPYEGPGLILEIRGNKCTLRTPDGKDIENVHLEDLCKVPENARSLERPDLQFPEDDDELYLDSLEVRRSPGMMLEDQGKSCLLYTSPSPRDS